MRSWSNSSSLPITSRLCQIICHLSRLNVQFVLVIAGYPDNLSRWNIHYPIWTMVISQKISPLYLHYHPMIFQTRYILWMEEILHQLIDGLSNYLQGFNHPFGDAGFRNHPQYAYICIYTQLYIYTLWLYTINTYTIIYIYTIIYTLSNHILYHQKQKKTSPTSPSLIVESHYLSQASHFPQVKSIPIISPSYTDKHMSGQIIIIHQP